MTQSLALKLSALAAATLLLAACGGAAEPTNDSATASDSNVMFEQLGNDATALEAAGNAAPFEQPAQSESNGGESNGVSEPSANVSAGDSEQPVLGESKGGDTGGNTVQGNATSL